ncbi:methyl-accepting chemotaxis protein [Geovibrio ferrireducens]|jgi:methyl-accepting chemotaxis protein|uniref:methyl-accepting chemotaxis protein n=1 Tax=Geovibrio ferrireducens TaxID=46201 RepID=UPI00224607DB|nr:methyl-accepting chemotaxis protein [Geovibrio ferrireducens]
MKMKIGTKILLSALVPAVFLSAVLTFIVVRNVNKMGQADVRMVSSNMTDMKKAELKNYIDIAVNSVSFLVNSAEFTPEEAKEEAKKILLRQTYGEDGYFFVYDRQGLCLVQPSNRKLEGTSQWDVKNSAGTYVTREVINAALSGDGYLVYSWFKASKNAEADKLSYSVSIPEWGWVVGTGFYIDDIEEETAKIEANISAEIKRLVGLFMTFSIVCLIAVAIIAYFVSRRISSSVSSVSESLKEIAEGEGDLTVQLPINSADEAGKLAEYFNTFLAKLRDIINTVKMNADTVASSSTELAASVEELSTTMNDQSAQVSGVATATEEMSVSAGEVTNSVGEGRRNIEETHSLTIEGNNKLQQAVKEMMLIKGNVETLGTTVASLIESSSTIGEIINVITDIADQTNLLALNAAIEAARAGDHGRGFAVVADEVRKLAERTQTSTGEISKIIGSLQNEARNASHEMTNARGRVESGVKIIDETKSTFERIVGSVDTLSSVNGIIQSAVEEQSKAILNINSNAQMIASGVEQSSAALQEVSATISNLQVQADELKMLVNKFKV